MPVRCLPSGFLHGNWILFVALPAGDRLADAVTDIPSDLAPVFWSAVIVCAISALTFMGSLTMLLGEQRPRVLRILWISASFLIASAVTWILILANRRF